MYRWLKKASSSLEEAIEEANSRNIPLQDLYTLAPKLYAKENNLNNDDLLIEEMEDETQAQVAEDYSHDEKSREQYKFHYVSSYLYCYVVAESVDEEEYDRIMGHVCNEMDLFTDD